MGVSVYEVPINVIKDVKLPKGACPQKVNIAIFDSIEHLEICGLTYDYAIHIDWLHHYPDLDKFLAIEGNKGIVCESCEEKDLLKELGEK